MCINKLHDFETKHPLLAHISPSFSQLGAAKWSIAVTAFIDASYLGGWPEGGEQSKREFSSPHPADVGSPLFFWHRALIVGAAYTALLFL